MKKKFLIWLLCIAAAVSITACSSDKTSSTEESSSISSSSSEGESSEEPAAPEEPEETSSVSSSSAVIQGKHILPCGMTLFYYNSVENDVIGNLRRSATADNYTPEEYALEYYNEMFSSADEVQSVGKTIQGTNTRLSVSDNFLFVDTLKYVEGEEHDANLLFSGDLLDSMVINLETGEPLSGAIPEEPEIEEVQKLEPVTEPEPEEKESEPVSSSSSEPTPPVLEPSSESIPSSQSVPSSQSSKAEPIFTITGELNEPDYPKTTDRLKGSTSSNTSASSGNTSSSGRNS